MWALKLRVLVYWELIISSANVIRNQSPDDRCALFGTHTCPTRETETEKERERGGGIRCVCVCVRVRACGFTRCSRLSLCGAPQNGDGCERI